MWPSDGTRVFRVAAERVGYDGADPLTVGGLPTGFISRRRSRFRPAPTGPHRDRADRRGHDATRSGKLTIRGEAVGVEAGARADVPAGRRIRSVGCSPGSNTIW